MGQWSRGHVVTIAISPTTSWRQEFSRPLGAAELAYLTECVQARRWDEVRVLVTLVEATA